MAITKGPGALALAAALGVCVLLAVIVVVVMVTNRAPTGDPGQLSEVTFAVPPDVALPTLADATGEWGLGEIGLTPAVDKMAGGAAVADLDRDGDLDLIVANGDVAVLLWDDTAYATPRLLGIDEAIGVTTADLDDDGWADVLVASATDADVIVWGGEWVTETNGAPDLLELPAIGPSSALLAGELSGDARIDIVRLGRGTDEPVADVLWVHDPSLSRVFVPVELPVPDRFSLAGELVDADGDSLLDIWITRDVGWDRGGDSVLSRRGDPTGPWTDVAPDLGVALEVDGMGITIADLDGDQTLDAYVSDLGDNEQLLGQAGGFVTTTGTGAAHIRPAGAPASVVSSTWGTGALDVNLDGVLDLVLASGGFPEGTVRNKIDDTSVAVAEPPSLLLGLGDGRFSNVWPQLGMELDVVARGLVILDVDGDGDDDFVVIDRRGSVHAVRNDTVGHAVTVALDESCAVADGHVVTVQTTQHSFQRLLSPHGYASAHAPSIAIGYDVDDLPLTVEVRSRDARVAGATLDHDEVPERLQEPITSVHCG